MLGDPRWPLTTGTHAERDRHEEDELPCDRDDRSGDFLGVGQEQMESRARNEGQRRDRQEARHCRQRDAQRNVGPGQGG